MYWWISDDGKPADLLEFSAHAISVNDPAAAAVTSRVFAVAPWTPNDVTIVIIVVIIITIILTRL